MQQDLFLNNEIDESVKSLEFIPLTSAEKVLDARIVKPTADGIVTWGDGFVTDLNNPLGPMRHMAKNIAWDFMNSMRPYRINRTFSGQKYCESKSCGPMKTHLAQGYYFIYVSRKITMVERVTRKISTLLWDIYRPEQRIYDIDHMDGNRQNDHFYNLRMTNQNNWNKCGSIYSVPGVHFVNQRNVWKANSCKGRGPTRHAELLAARDRIFLIRKHPDCQPSDIEAFLRRTLTALAYRERHRVDAFGNSVPLEDLDVRVPEWLSYPVEHFLKHQPALQS